MQTPLWKKLQSLSNDISQLFDDNLDRQETEDFPFKFEGWKDTFWKSSKIQKCHLKIIDSRESRKLWLMHINIFPSVEFNLPILGFDIVAGPNKITGAFFDYSTLAYHPYSDYMEIRTQNLKWNKPRELPEWAQNIFSQNMIAAGNIRDEDEIDQLCEVTYDLTKSYVENIKSNAFKSQLDLTQWHNMYCINQKKNEHLHKSILAMGISEEDKDRYINEVLFEEI